MQLDRRSFLATGMLVLAASPGGARGISPLDALLGQRRMTRRYRPDPVGDDVVRRLLEAARRAPSAGHTEPAAFVVVRDPERKRRLAEAALGQMFVAEAPVVIVACADRRRSLGRYPHRGSLYAIVDTAFASMLLLLKVVEEGLGACFVGALDSDRVATVLGLPEDVLPIAVIPVGVPAETPRDLPLRPLDEITHREAWKEPSGFRRE